MEQSRHADGKPYVQQSRHVDQTFLERLHRLDSNLEPRWNPARCRWEIWRSGKYILTVQSNDGKYIDLDNRVLQKLWLCDSQRYGNELGYIRHLRLEDEKLSKMKVKEQDEYIRAVHRDMAPLLRKRKTVNLGGKEK